MTDPEEVPEEEIITTPVGIDWRNAFEGDDAWEEIEDDLGCPPGCTNPACACPGTN